jgi:arsenate reductase
MKYVLFVCNHNAGRSQMAQAFFEAMAPADVGAESAGRDPVPRIWPTVVEVMREVGIDIAHRRPKKLLLEMQLHADWAVTLNCGASCPYVPTTVEDWDVEDPAGKRLDAVRVIRDDIQERVRDLVDNRIDAIRSDRTAHELRLGRILPQLVKEFETTRTPDQIRACADAVLCEFDDAPVRSHVFTLVYRRTRECLASDFCEALEAPLVAADR